ncbi:MAG: DUF448 domain-containing protein [Pseudomonadota bacterium]
MSPRRRRPRRNVADGQVGGRAQFLRFVVDPNGRLTPDMAGALPGRGLWVAATRSALERARAGRFAKAARRSVDCPDDLVTRVDGLLARRCIEAIGLARRGGRAVFGFEQVRAQLSGSDWTPAVLLHAADASSDGLRKLAGPAKAVGAAVASALSGAELGQAFGRESIVHAAIGPGPLAERLKTDAVRLAGLRMDGN